MRRWEGLEKPFSREMLESIDKAYYIYQTYNRLHQLKIEDRDSYNFVHSLAGLPVYFCTDGLLMVYPRCRRCTSARQGQTAK